MKINSTNFGSIKVDEITYNHDIVISVDKTITKRDKSRSKRIKGHRELSKVEIEELLSQIPEAIFLGMGQYGSLPMSRETLSFLDHRIQSNDIILITGKTPDIVDKVNQILQSEKRVNGIFHTTC